MSPRFALPIMDAGLHRGGQVRGADEGREGRADESLDWTHA